MLERFEVFNLKTIFRGFHAGTDADTIRESLFPTILYPTSFYERLLDRADIDAVIDELLTVGNRYYRPLSQAHADYESSGQLATLELALDRHYFAGSRAMLSEMAGPNAEAVRHMLGTEVDILNLVYAMRVFETTVDSAERDRYVLQGGERISETTVRSLLNSPDRASFVRAVENTYYGRRLGPLDESIDANRFQEQLENLLYREMTHLEPGQFFDIGLAATYIWRVNAEAINLRVIAGGLYRRASREEIERRLITVPGMMPEEVTAS
jgi:V/A-type H+-transporting ATPase subunit C